MRARAGRRRTTPAGGRRGSGAGLLSQLLGGRPLQSASREAPPLCSGWDNEACGNSGSHSRALRQKGAGCGRTQQSEKQMVHNETLRGSAQPGGAAGKAEGPLLAGRSDPRETRGLGGREEGGMGDCFLWEAAPELSLAGHSDREGPEPRAWPCCWPTPHPTSSPVDGPWGPRLLGTTEGRRPGWRTVHPGGSAPCEDSYRPFSLRVAFPGAGGGGDTKRPSLPSSGRIMGHSH